MAQKVTGYIKLQIPAGKATPAPPVGPALGQHGVNIMSFTKEFNERTQKDIGYIIPVVITVYADRSFSFITKTPPAPVLIKKELGLESASGVPNKTKVQQRVFRLIYFYRPTNFFTAVYHKLIHNATATVFQPCRIIKATRTATSPD